MTGAPRQLKTVTNVGFKAAYEACLPTLSTEPQEFTVYLAPPVFIMSPRIKLYRAEDIVKFKGYLSNFQVGGVSEEGEPEATLTLTICEERLVHGTWVAPYRAVFLVAGKVLSAHDNNIHHVTGQDLRRLYRITTPARICDEDSLDQALLGFNRNEVLILRPDPTGKYDLPPEVRTRL